MSLGNPQGENAAPERKYIRDGIWKWIVDNRWLLTVTVMSVVAMLIWTAAEYWFCVYAGDCRDPETQKFDLARFHYPLKIILILVAPLVGWFLDIFTGQATDRKIYHMVAFCYVFPFVVVAGILLPLFAYPDALPDPPKPVGIILGCNERPILPVDKDLVPDGIRCFNRSDQWLVNLGGHAEVIPDELRAEREREAIDAAKAVSAVQRPLPGKDAKSAKTEVNEKAEEKAKPDEKARAEEKKKDESVEQKPAAAAGATQANPSATTEPTRPRYIITGGLVVPLYFVIIAIFGGFVSMLRRVPEYQERVSIDKAAPDYLTLERAREKLVFEALQLLAAPLIAITAYYLVDPGSRATSIALAFIAGFSSETVLLYIRALAEKIQPSTSRTAHDVEVKPTSLVFAKQVVGTESPPQIVRLTNRSGTALTGAVSVPAEFGCTPADFNAPAGSTVSFAITFKPTSPGKKTGDLQIRDNASGSPRIVHLTGDA